MDTLIKPVFAEIGIKQPPGAGIQVGNEAAGSLLQTILTNTITIFFIVAGVGVVIMFLWGSVNWILSGGDKEKVAAARKRITTAIIGLALMALSFFIINLLGEVIGFNPLGNLNLPFLGDPIKK